MNHPNLRRRAALLAGAALITTALVAPPGSATPGTDAPSSSRFTFAPGRYVVTLADKPLATYQGGVTGLKATKPAAGRKVEVNSSNAKAYRSFLTGRHAQVAAEVGAKVDHDYSTTLNGFAASLTSKQVNELSKTPGVVSVVPDQLHVALDDRKLASHGAQASLRGDRSQLAIDRIRPACRIGNFTGRWEFWR